MITSGTSVVLVPISACIAATCFAKTLNVVRFMTMRCSTADALPSAANGSTKPKSMKTLSEVLFILTLFTYDGCVSGESNASTGGAVLTADLGFLVAISTSIPRSSGHAHSRGRMGTVKNATLVARRKMAISSKKNRDLGVSLPSFSKSHVPSLCRSRQQALP